MEITGQFLYGAYRAGVGGVNHDGTFALPSRVTELGEKQQAGWDQAALEANRRAEDAGKARDVLAAALRRAHETIDALCGLVSPAEDVGDVWPRPDRDGVVVLTDAGGPEAEGDANAITASAMPLWAAKTLCA